MGVKQIDRPRAIKKKVKEPEPINYKDKIYKCSCCGREVNNPEGVFYKTHSSIFKDNEGYSTLCRYCLNDKYIEYSNRFDECVAMKIICHYVDMPFVYGLYSSAAKNNESLTIGKYLSLTNGTQYRRKTFVNTLLDKRELYIDEDEYQKGKESRWKISDHKNRNNVIEIIGYDPFEGYNEEDRRFLFNDIIGYLEEDGIEEDFFKISQIIQLINNNYQIRKLDMSIAKLNPQRDIGEITDLNKLKKTLVDSNDKIAKENGISARNRRDQENGRSTLTYLMRELRELDFEEAKTNYYNQLKSEGTQWAANVSLKAIKENGFFDENDFKDMGEFQYKKIKELQESLDDVMEEKRLLLIENGNLKELLESNDIKYGPNESDEFEDEIDG